MPDDRLSIFVHLHKTGGTTLRGILFREYEPHEILNLDFVRGEDQLASYRASPEQQASVRAIAGHLAFGLADELDRAANYVTLVREPTARVLSYFDYLQANPDVPETYPRTTIEEFVADPNVGAEVHNEQTRLLGSSRGSECTAPTRDTLEQAKRNIERHVTVAGTTERFDASVVLMAKRLDWPARPYYVPRNVGSSRDGRGAISPELRAEIIERNQLDVELHQWVSARLDDEVGRAGLRAEIALFRLLNTPTGHRVGRLVRRYQAKVSRVPTMVRRAEPGR